MIEFEHRIKGNFGNSGADWPIEVGTGLEDVFPNAGIREGYMTFSNEDILSCFQPVVVRIIDLIKKQIGQLNAQNRFLQARRPTDASYSKWTLS